MEYAFTKNFQEGFNKILNAALYKLGILRIFVPNQSQAYKCMIKAGYSHKPRSKSGGNPVTALVIDVQSLASKAMDPLPELERLNIKILTVDREEDIYKGEKAVKTITLEMKKYHLPRLLCRWMNLQHAIALEEITCHNGTKEDIAIISKAFTPVPWCYCGLDGI